MVLQHYLECFSSVAGNLLRYMLKLLHSLTEVSDPLDDSETGGHSVAPPALGNDAWNRDQQTHWQEQ